MATSLETRFNGNSQEVIKDVEMYGWSYSMEKWKVRDPIAFNRWYEGKTETSIFKVRPVYPASSGESLGKQMVEAMAGYILRTQVTINQQSERIKHLEWQLKTNEADNRQLATPILAKFKGVDNGS